MITKQFIGFSLCMVLIIVASSAWMINEDGINGEGLIVSVMSNIENSFCDNIEQPLPYEDRKETFIPAEKQSTSNRENIHSTDDVRDDEPNDEQEIDHDTIQDVAEDEYSPNQPEDYEEYTQSDYNNIIDGDLNGDGEVDSKDEKIVEGYWRLNAPYILKCPDINGDNIVDIDDVFEILNVWGPCKRDCSADLNCDLIVDNRDECIIEGYWGFKDEYVLASSPDLNADGNVDIDDIFFILGHWT